MDTDSIAAKEHKTRKGFLPLRIDRGEGRGEVSISSSQLSTIDRFHVGSEMSGEAPATAPAAGALPDSVGSCRVCSAASALRNGRDFAR